MSNKHGEYGALCAVYNFQFIDIEKSEQKPNDYYLKEHTGRHIIRYSDYRNNLNATIYPTMEHPRIIVVIYFIVMHNIKWLRACMAVV